MAFVLILTAASAAFTSTRFSWPTWVTAAVGAVLTLAAGLGSRSLETLSERLSLPLRRVARRAAARRAVADGGEQVQQVTSRLALNIHPAIPLPEDADAGLSDEFPEYVPRDVDADLRTWIRGHTAVGGLVVLVGAAAAGKTRCLYEALRAEVPTWQMLQPDSGLKVNELAEAGVDLSRSVLWLNDLQTFFGADTLTVATVRYMLAGRCGPVLLAGTIRSEELDGLLARVDDERREINRNSREILGMLARWSGRLGGAERAVRFDLPSRFTTTELSRAEALAAVDPRIKIAVRDADEGNVTATLAGTYDLIHHWMGEGDRSGQAIITAAVIARRCGHPDPIPLEILEALALARLSARGSAPPTAQWLDAAIEWAGAPVMGQIAAITPVRRTVGVVDGYNVSDILVQHSYDQDQGEVSEALDDERTWHALLDLVPTSVAMDIGSAAYQAERHRIAARAWLSPAERGNVRAMRNLGWLWVKQGRQPEAEEWFRRAVALGDAYAMVGLGELLAMGGEVMESDHWLRKAADGGDAYTMGALGFWLAGRGETAEAMYWYRKSADLGEPNSMANLGYHYARQGAMDEAEHWNRKAAELGHVGAMENLGGLLEARGERASALEWFRRGAERGYAAALADPRRFRPWPGESTDGGISNSILALADGLRDEGVVAEAEEWYRRGAGLGDARAASQLARLLEGRDDVDEAYGWHRKAAELADENLRRNGTTLRSAYGPSAILRHTGIMCDLADRLVESDHLDDAELWYQRAAEKGDPRAMASLGRLLASLGRAEEADLWVGRAADQGQTD